ncbi:hypothetical protein PFISCL1PPCAC_17691 [Pristionchus fissidentatus]|uniref:G protein-coupled receptor n=1 Tax=Pristionchus fissidentatus TaxID=1538716 RepID=A0AAV5W961_9BILA|nr:hypothetical protein PFISCL1PPCAC_17691 [Pristionchus fissidentatus]
MTPRRNVRTILDHSQQSTIMRYMQKFLLLEKQHFNKISSFQVLIFLKKMGISGSGSIAIRISPTMSTTISSNIFLSLVEATVL